MSHQVHSPRVLAAGVRLRPLGADSSLVRSINSRSMPFSIRVLATALTTLLFFTSSPALLAMTASQAFGGAGAGAGGGKGGAANLNNAGAASAALTAARAQANLKRTDAAVAAMKAFQTSARRLLPDSSLVKNGLAAGWLDPYNPTAKVDAHQVPVTWSGINSLKQTGNTVDITQGNQNAYLYWNNFSVGPQTTVNFDQSKGGKDVGNWIAFNKVMGTANPTQIFGSITAQGQVYILNQNGILFHNGSQVNTHSLVASTLPINGNLAGDSLDGITARGIANNPDYQFLFSALPVSGGQNGPTPTFNPALAAVGLSSKLGDVTVEKGATINSPVNSAHTGGLVALIGPHVENDGSISTPNGQTILAAGLQVGLTPHPSSDPSLRGMDVYVGKVTDPSIGTISLHSGTVENKGYLGIMEGDLTMAGSAVLQNGVIDSSTSVSLNGRIDLLANYNASYNASYKSDGTQGQAILYKDTGLVLMGEGSTMRILPDWSSRETVAGSKLALNSTISIQGKNIEMARGSLIQAPGAIATSGAVSETGASLPTGIMVQAGTWFDPGTHLLQFAYTDGGISMGAGAVIDVSGSTGVQVDSTQNFIDLQLRGAELSNSPLQRNGSVRGKSLTIDSRITGTYNGQYWMGTPLGDATGFAGLIQRTVGQLTEQGGTVSLNAGNSFAMATGSTINVSGGWAQYSGGTFTTTELIYQGHLVNISQATPDRTYSGVYSSGATVESSDKWGVKRTYQSPLDPTLSRYEAPYISGAGGGSILIQAPRVHLNGSLDGTTVVGPKQVRATATLSSLPESSSFNLSIVGQSASGSAITTVSADPVPWVLNSDLTSEGFGRLKILNHDGSIVLPDGVVLNAGINGDINLEAANIRIAGQILAPGGQVSLTADLAPYSVLNQVASLPTPTTSSVEDVVNQNGTPTYQSGSQALFNLDGTPAKHLRSGIVQVGSSAVVTTAGNLSSVAPNAGENIEPIALNGGRINITGYQTLLNKGGLLDVSGGALFQGSGNSSYGNAGSISVSGGQDAVIKTIDKGSVELGSTLKGFSGLGGGGGSLAITAPAIQIGGKTPDSRVLLISPELFSQSGFSGYDFSGIGLESSVSQTDFIPGIRIASGTTIHPEVLSTIIMPTSTGFLLQPYAQPVGLSPVVNLSLKALGLSDGSRASGQQLLVRGDLVVESGVNITLSPQISMIGNMPIAKSGSLSLAGNSVAVLGDLAVPGGSISIKGASSFPQNVITPDAPLVSVDLASSARLSTAGEALFLNDPSRARSTFGVVIPGGVISISGNLVAESGSVLDASGASSLCDLLPYQVGIQIGTGVQQNSTTYRVDSSGGSIALSGAQLLYTDATLIAASGGSTAPGGSLSLSSGTFSGGVTDFNLWLSQHGKTIPSAFRSSGTSAVGQEVADGHGNSSGGGHLAVDSFHAGGFDSISLGGNILFLGPVTLSAPQSLRVATGGVLSTDSLLSLRAPYVSLGTPFLAPIAPGSLALSTVFGTSTTPIFAPPTFGTGQLEVTAQLIDIGNLSLKNIAKARLSAAGGAIRGDGTFAMAGNLEMNSAMVYPASGTRFTVAAYNHDQSSGQALSSGGIQGSVTINQSGKMAQLPLSAVGVLSVYADTISQGGTLLSPFGTINLGNNGSSVPPWDPVSGLTVPTTQNLDLSAGSTTSISGVDARTGAVVSLPYGTSVDGTTWVDPSGTVITTTGLPSKSIQLGAKNVNTERGAVINLRGGGNLFASEWVSGMGGTMNLLGSSSGPWSSSAGYQAGDLVSYNGSTWSVRQANSGVQPVIGPYWSKLPQYYAIIPGYQAKYSPTGYADGSPAVGSQVTISAGGGLAAGTYTLLPASYATQPGAFLISPTSSAAPISGSVNQPDGTVIVSGTQINGLDTAVATPTTTTLFQLLSPAAIAARVESLQLNAGSFFASVPTSSRTENAGNLTFKATSLLTLNGVVLGKAASGGIAATIDISAPGTIEITSDGSGGEAGNIVLGASQLASWSFGSLLIGGSREASKNGLTPLSVSAEKVVMDAGTALKGNDIILAANDAITLKSGASIQAEGNGVAPDPNLTDAGNGVLLRVSSDRSDTFTRSGVSSQEIQQALRDGNGNPITPSLTLENGSSLGGNSVMLDSSASASISSTSLLNSKVIELHSGGIAILMDPALTAANLDPADAHSLVLAGSTLSGIENATALTLSSYSTMDFYGGGSFGSSALTTLQLHAGEIRGFDLEGSSLSLSAHNEIHLDNALGVIAPGPATATPDGILELNAATIFTGANTVAIDQFSHVSMNATGELVGNAKGGLSVGTEANPTDLSVTTPLLTGTAGSSIMLKASGNLELQSPDSGYATPATVDPGLGAKLSLQGSSVTIDTSINLPSGAISVEAKSGDLIVGGQGSGLLNTGGTSRSLFNVTKYTDGGSIALSSDIGNVVLASGTTLNVSAQPGAGSAGTLSVNAPSGFFTIDPNATLSANGGSGGKNGSFTMDVGSLDPSGGNLSLISSIAPSLNSAGFTQALSFRIRDGDVAVETAVMAHQFSLVADQGSIDVTPNGVINASGVAANGDGVLTGGAISLIASGSVILEPNSGLSVRADNFDSAGKGGSVFLSAGASVHGATDPTAALDLQTASTIDLGVNATPERIDQLGGVLRLRAPQTADGSDLQISHMDSSITGASSIALEGYKLYDVTGTSGEITQSLRDTIASDAQTFFGAPGVNSDTAASILNRLTANQDSSISSLLNLSPGVEILNQSGNLILNTDWDLSMLRTGVNAAPGFLTLRSSGSVIFHASLSDGFSDSSYSATLLPQNQNLPVNFQSWSYQVTAGADFGSASLAIVNPPAQLVAAKSGEVLPQSGNVVLGVSLNGQNIDQVGGLNAVTANTLSGYYQVIRTGSGDLSINASGDLQLWNQFASIYTAGVQVTDPTLHGTFDLPSPRLNKTEQANASLGALQQQTPYSPQFSYSGGNIAIFTGQNITHLTLDSQGNPIADSVRELPVNWLYRRGSVDQTTGLFQQMVYGSEVADRASTTWWVDFSNFFEGVGALGGGNITLNAGNNIANVDAVIPTSFRLPSRDAGGNPILAGSVNGVELGGGDLNVRAANNIDAGVYYVERGTGVLHAGGSVISNPTRDSQLPQYINSSATPGDPLSYLPTTLFLGKGSFHVDAGGSVLLGPVANPFLMPQGVNNSFWYKDYFSTYNPSDIVDVSSLGGSITFREAAVSPSNPNPLPILQNWMQGFTVPANPLNSSFYQPWLRLSEPSINNLGSLISLAPPSLSATALSGDITIQGNYIMAPSALGNISLIAEGSISGLAPTGGYSGQKVWASSQLNLSDANPNSLAGINNPLSLRAMLAPGDQVNAQANAKSKIPFTAGIALLFEESGSYSGQHGVLQTKQQLHDSTLLHYDDPTPVQIYAQNGNISGLELFSAKQADLSAGANITDIGLYIQNNRPNNVSIVSAGGDIIAYDPQSPLQRQAQSGNTLNLSVPLQSGDIQISGPGTLEVLAGGNVDLGNGANNSDGTGVGITSIANARNPSLPSQGADLVVGAGVKLPMGLSSPDGLALQNFTTTLLAGAQGASYLSELSDAMTYSGAPLPGNISAASFAPGSTDLSQEERANLELQLFYLVLTETGINHNKVGKPGYGSYAEGEKAISTIFGNAYAHANVSTWARDIATKSGGNINILIPSGALTLQTQSAGTPPLAPPGIVTDAGGSINIYSRDDISIGISRIFTLRGGDILIWSDKGNIAAGSSAKTVQSAAPTQVLIDPQSGNVQTDLAGLGTGGGIGVLATVAGVLPGNVNLIAPSGVIDAGDAGIRSSGNLNLAATKVLNADNIAASGSTSGAPPAAPPPAAPNVSGATAASSASAANNSAAQGAAQKNTTDTTELPPSIINIDILGYGNGGEDQGATTSSESASPPQASL